MQKTGLPLILCLLMLLCGCGTEKQPTQPMETFNPYAGMVQAESGYGTKIWVKEYEDVPVNPLRDVNLAAGGTITDENGVNYTLKRGIDISEHQGRIDWETLAVDAPDFVMIRAGYRGYGEAGSLRIDTYFHENMQGAIQSGIPVGLYFFSQAITPEEAVEEAEFLLFLLTDYGPEKVSLPIYFDWEDIDYDDARTDGLDGTTLTDCAVAFCERLKKAGYDAGIYTYRSLAYFSYDLSRLAEYPFWIGALGNCPDYFYRFDIWQCSNQGEVPGIEGDVDVDLIFVPEETASRMAESSSEG